jgi:hypothetical protein
LIAEFGINSQADPSIEVSSMRYRIERFSAAVLPGLDPGLCMLNAWISDDESAAGTSSSSTPTATTDGCAASIGSRRCGNSRHLRGT